MLAERELAAWIRSEILKANAACVLDVGCGFGWLSRFLARGQILVTGLDRSPIRIAIAKRMARRVSYKQQDATEMTFSGEFDIAIVSRVLHSRSQEHRLRIFENARRAVRSGGLLIVVDVSISARETWRSKAIQHWIWFEEFLVGMQDPEHYRNFQHFMNGGGLVRWVEQHGGDGFRKTEFMGGCLTAIAIHA